MIFYATANRFFQPFQFFRTPEVSIHKEEPSETLSLQAKSFLSGLTRLGKAALMRGLLLSIVAFLSVGGE